MNPVISHDDEYFREWLATFPEELFAIIRVYADDELFCGGFIAAPAKWAKFSQRWKVVLNDFSVPYFHFKEFADKDNKCKNPNNPYLAWGDKKRASFLNELAIVLSESAVPVGGILNIAKFYARFSKQLNSHWPGLSGQVLFVFDETDNEAWIASLHKVHKTARKFEARIGGLSFEDKMRCPPLQAADLFAYNLLGTNQRTISTNDGPQEPNKNLAA